MDPVVDPVRTEHALKAITPNGFPLPKRTTMLNARNEGTGIPGIWRNVNDFTKEPAADGYSSIWLNDFVRLEKDTLLWKNALDNPPVYLSSSVFSLKDLARHKTSGEIKNKNIYLENSDHEKLQALHLEHALTDTAYFLQFGPNAFRIKVRSAGEQVLTLLQSAYKGWQVSVAGKETNWMKSNYLFMSVLIPKGEYEVVFRYENAPIKYGFIAAAMAFFLVLSGIVFVTLREKKTS